MKKKFTIVFLSLLILLLVGCTTNEVETKNPDEEYLNTVIEMIAIPNETSKNLDLPSSIDYDGDSAYIKWSSNNRELMSDDGRIVRNNQNRDAVLTANVSYNDLSKSKNFTITILGYNPEEQFNMIIPKIKMPSTLSENLQLITSMEGYDVEFKWKSDNKEILSDEGIYNEPNFPTKVTMKLTLSLDGKTKEVNYEMMTLNTKTNNHLLIDTPKKFNPTNFNDVVLDNDNHLILLNDAIYGEYVSDIFETASFKSMVGSWSCVTGIDRTVEVLFRVRVNGNWSDYLSYGEWGLGKNNYGISQTTSDKLAKMSTDELMICNNLTATAVQYKIILKRDTASSSSPVLSLVAMTFEIPGYNYSPSQAELEKLPNKVDYDVPKLNQNIVPQIGNIICSATSTTMLLKYKGMSFLEYDSSYEHRYVAALVYDSAHKIYGNWVYNVAVMGAFGFNAYVKRMYSIDELKLHLYNVGPIAASVKGNMQGYYTTNGHLIVIRGYEIVNGVTYFICNDPNLRDVEVRYTENTIKNVWRNIAYVIE